MTEKKSHRYQRVENAIFDLAQPIVHHHDLYLEKVTFHTGKNSIVRVVVDLPWGPGGVDVDVLADVSRDISSALDEEEIVKGSYNLEVSTPGVDRKMTEKRHFSRAQGRKIELTLLDGSRLKARLESMTDECLYLLTRDKAYTYSFDDIAEGKVCIEL
ncbi:MAG: ribosome maturation factor RimP [Actinomycetaceae bacterium]|nr:ribosome maturation factor RimP [Actinomycetaceae bacterium]